MSTPIERYLATGSFGRNPVCISGQPELMVRNVMAERTSVEERKHLAGLRVIPTAAARRVLRDYDVLETEKAEAIGLLRDLVEAIEIADDGSEHVRDWVIVEKARTFLTKQGDAHD